MIISIHDYLVNENSPLSTYCVFIMIHEKQVQPSVLVFLKLHLFWQTSVADLKKIKVGEAVVISATGNLVLGK